MYFIIKHTANGYIEENNGNKYLMLVPADESKSKLNEYEKYGEKSKVLSYQYLITQMIMNKNI